jgi:hypothetical protein
VTGLLLLAGVGLGLLVLSGKKYPEGMGPFDEWTPDMLEGRTTDRVTASSGRKYLVTSTRPDAQNKTFHVAERQGRKQWVSYAHDRGTGQRELYRVYATDPDAIAEMKVDWGLA